ncbi:hypothetical protein SNEBB_004722 [Seison nebaliae]|nr:hypothetical protein SNEBB_004722 [Seison nebaliae]
MRLSLICLTFLPYLVQSINIEYSDNGKNWILCAKVTVHSFANKADVVYPKLDSGKMQKISENMENDFIYFRLNMSDGNHPMTIIPPRELFKTKNGIIRLSLLKNEDNNPHHIYGMNSEIVHIGKSEMNRQLNPFRFFVDISNVGISGKPNIQSFLKKKTEEEMKLQKNKKENRSFLSKYWMYIVILFIFIMVTSAANPDSAQ